MQSKYNDEYQSITKNSYSERESLNIEQKKQIIREFKQRNDVSGVAKNLGCSVQSFWNAMGRAAGEQYTDLELRFIQAMYEKMLERQRLMDEVGATYNIMYSDAD